MWQPEQPPSQTVARRKRPEVAVEAVVAGVLLDSGRGAVLGVPEEENGDGEDAVPAESLVVATIF